MIRRSNDASLTPDNPLSLGERLRWLRKQRGLTQVEMAQAVGCEQNMISSWEVGRTHPTAATQAALARFYQIPQTALETGEDFLALATQAIEALRAEGRTRLEPASSVEVRLEAAPAGKVMLLDLATEATRATDSNDAMMQFLRACQSGREVWVVMR